MMGKRPHTAIMDEHFKINASLIHHIEKALCFKLRDDQIKYITGEITHPDYDSVRGTGKTTAYCIKLALSYGDPLILKYVDSFSDAKYSGLDGADASAYSKNFFVDRLMSVRARLENYGFPVRDIRGYKAKHRGGFIVGD